jgi:hypothetical protein
MRSAIASSALVLSFVSVVHAAGPDDARRAEQLFEQARKAMDQGDYARACPMLEESQRLDPGGGTLLNLALCHDKSGKLTIAKREYEETLVKAHAAGRKDRERIATEAIAGLVRRIPRVVLIVRETAGDLTVRIDGEDIPRSAWSTLTLDPGPHHVDATAMNRVPWSTEIQLVEGEAVAIDVPPLSTPEALAPLPSPLPPPPLIPPDVHVGGQIAFVPAATQRHWLFWPLLAGSGAALAVSGVTGILALVEKGTADSVCNASRHACIDPKGVEAIDRARTDAWISTITLGVGVVAAAVAIFLPNQKADKAGLQVIAGPTFAGLSWHAPLP